MAKDTKYIFVTGGVLSSLGKGLASAAIGALLESRGLTVTIQKLDPYINVDPGTMRPFQHGEVYVTDDGAEAAGKRVEIAQAGDQIVRRTDHRGGAVGEGRLVDGLVGILEGFDAGPHQGADVIFIVPAEEAVLGLGAGFLAAFGDVPGDDDAPVLAVDGVPVLGRRVFGEAPLRRQRLQAGRRHRATTAVAGRLTGAERGRRVPVG